MYDSYLEHHGIKGQRWGVRRFQNPDGTRTSSGKKRARQYAKELNRLDNRQSTASRTYSSLRETRGLFERTRDRLANKRDRFEEKGKTKKIAKIDSKLAKVNSKIDLKNKQMEYAAEEYAKASKRGKEILAEIDKSDKFDWSAYGTERYWDRTGLIKDINKNVGRIGWFDNNTYQSTMANYYSVRYKKTGYQTKRGSGKYVHYHTPIHTEYY